jgi:membrane associated rhomboid family serine protease
MPRYPSRSGPPSSPSSLSFGPGPISTALKAIIGANVVLFLATLFYAPLQIQLGLVPMWVLHEYRLWQPVTYMFIHAGLFHIIFNMLALWMFGTELERIWGTRFFLKFYFVTGIGAAVITILLSLVPFLPTRALYGADIVGASGAIYGVLLAYALYFPERKIYYMMLFPIPARIFVLIMGAVAFISSLSESGGVANATHLSGLLVAYVYLTTVRKGPRMQLNPWAEVKYRWVKWRLATAKKRFDVYTGGRSDGPGYSLK